MLRTTRKELGSLNRFYMRQIFYPVQVQSTRYLDFTYLEMKIWSLFVHENLTTGNKIFWKKTWEIATEEQFLLLSTILQESITYSFEMWLFELFFSSLLQVWFIDVRISRGIPESLGLRDNESRLFCKIQNNCSARNEASLLNHWNITEKNM